MIEHGILLQQNLGGSFAEHPEASVSILYHGAHGFPDGIKGVDFVKLLFRDFVADCLIVFFQVHGKAQQGTFSFVAHLTIQASLLLRGLEEKIN